MTPDQKGVARGMAAGMLAALLVVPLPLYWHGLPSIPSEAFGLLAVWLFLAASVVFWIFVGVARLAKQRFFNPDDIDAAAAATGTPQARILQAILQNTLEQAVLAVIVYGAWLFWAPAAWRMSAVLAAILFLAGRLLFTLGYSRGAQARAMGFALTFYPSVLLLFMVLVRVGFVVLTQ